MAVDGSGGPGGYGGSGGGDGAGGTGGTAEGGAIYNTGTLSMIGAKFSGDKTKGGKGANAGGLGKGGAGGTGGTGADGNNPGGDDDGDAAGLGGDGGNAGDGGSPSLGGEAGGAAAGGAIFTATSFTPANLKLSGNSVKGGAAGAFPKQADGGKGGKGGGGNGGQAASGADGMKSPLLTGTPAVGVAMDPNISPSSIQVITVKNPSQPSKPPKPPKKPKPKPGAKCVVPKLAGDTLAAAKAALTKAHCAVGKVAQRKSKTVAKGHVISSSPGAGTKRPAGTMVNLTTSNGKS
jgi:hypothetical protein